MHNQVRGPKGRERGTLLGRASPSPPARESEERCMLPAGSGAEPQLGLGGAPAEIEFGAF